MKIHAYHIKPTGLIRAFYQLCAGYKYCRAVHQPLRRFIPLCINPMMAVWNYYQFTKDMPQPGTLIDAGANASQMARLLQHSCKKDVQILSFEPIPSMQPIGKRFNIALSDKDGEFDFYIPQGNDDELGSLSKEYIENAELGCKTITVKAARMETLINEGVIPWEQLPRPILLKMDTEGHELNILKGFGKYLNDVDRIISEVGNEADRTKSYDLTEMCNYLTAYGFNDSRILYSCFDGANPSAYMDVLFRRI